MRRRFGLAALACLTLGVAAPHSAAAARYAIGVESLDAIAPLRRALGPGAESLAPLPAVVVERTKAPLLLELPGATYVERLGTRTPSFEPNDPLALEQWHLAANHAFDFWPTLPLLPPVRVAVIDSGIDGGHPDLRSRIVAAESFVGTPAREDATGHGTFVAGLIGAAIDNAEGVAGMAPSAELLIAKVVAEDGTIDVEAEARAIRWAVDEGARVINMSLGGVRDPRDRSRDTYSPLEEAALAYATRKGVVVVAAVGNGDAAPSMPWPYASYPAALPHVLGVSALARNGSSPAFSNRDRIYNDLAAPGQGLLSTFPRALTASFKECADQGYSSCGSDEYRAAEGTSFAAPQVSAAAAALIALRPSLRPEQVTALLTGTAVDVNAGTGCRACALRRDALTGWGRLDVAAALRTLAADTLPPADAREPNDDLGAQAAPVWGPIQRFQATLDFWDDQNDVYAIRLRKGQPVYVSVRGPAGVDTNLIFWRPGARSIEHFGSLGRVAAQSARPGAREYLEYRAPTRGTYYVQVKLGSRGGGRYKLTIVKA
ncbi:MAG: S8 family serine peptidase [Gaiellaceae bacterium MAG52_C11]|nr:S8 family serine peptidase [Candidatus Gaiellasilicea maunaloa]